MGQFDSGFGLMLLASLISAVSLAARPEPLTVDILDKDQKAIGTATLTELSHGVKIEVDARGVPPGKHAFHVHQNGKCAGPDFNSAGDHFASDGKKHGFDAREGHHDGDMPNLMADPDGVIKAELVNTEVTLNPGTRSLLRNGGTALVLHEKADDYKSQPAGNAGTRIACAEVKR